MLGRILIEINFIWCTKMSFQKALKIVGVKKRGRRVIWSTSSVLSQMKVSCASVKLSSVSQMHVKLSSGMDESALVYCENWNRVSWSRWIIFYWSIKKKLKRTIACFSDVFNLEKTERKRIILQFTRYMLHRNHLIGFVPKFNELNRTWYALFKLDNARKLRKTTNNINFRLNYSCLNKIMN